jgi:protein-disulfide isomerase
MLATIYNRILIVLAFGGIFVSGVLSAGEIFGKDVPCGLSGGCHQVAAHPSSHMLGFPNAYLGLLAYLAFAGLAVLREILGIKRIPELVTLGLILGALGSLFSLWLTYISLTVVKATCYWCLSSLGIILATTVLTGLLQVQFSKDKSDVAPTSRNPGLILTAICALLAFGGLGIMGAQMAGNQGNVTELAADTDFSPLITPDAHVKNPNGQVTLIEFGDLVCPSCRHLYPSIEKAVDGSNGKLRYVFHHFPLYQLKEHIYAIPAGMISELAAAKGRFWDFVADCYGGSDDQAPEPQLDDLLAFGKSLGVDPDDARKRIAAADENDPTFKKVQDDLDLGRKFGVRATPTFILIAPGQKPLAVVGPKILDYLKAPNVRNQIQ